MACLPEELDIDHELRQGQLLFQNPWQRILEDCLSDEVKAFKMDQERVYLLTLLACLYITASASATCSGVDKTGIPAFSIFTTSSIANSLPATQAIIGLPL